MITRRVALTSSPRRHPHPDHHHDFAGALGIGRDALTIRSSGTESKNRATSRSRTAHTDLSARSRDRAEPSWSVCRRSTTCRSPGFGGCRVPGRAGELVMASRHRDAVLSGGDDRSCRTAPAAASMRTVIPCQAAAILVSVARIRLIAK
jgi:hypothetical protein